MVRGQGSGLNKARLLDVELSSICSRNRYTTDPAPVIAGLRATAGKRVDILAHAAGLFAGYFDDEHTRTLTAALRAEIDGIDPWVEAGRKRRGGPAHSAPLTPHP